MYYNDVMIDIETTGTHVDNNAIIQIAGVKFNLETRDVCSDTFDRCLHMAPNRYMEESCRTDFWGKIPKVFQEIVERSEDPQKVMHDFINWATASDMNPQGVRFWAKPITFDYAFIASYCRQFNLKMPFHYRVARDMNSYIAGLSGCADHPKIDKEIPFEGQEHHALWDSFHQIKVLFAAQDRYIKAEVL